MTLGATTEYNTYGNIEIKFEQISVQEGYKLNGEKNRSLVINRTEDNTLSFVEKNGEFVYDIDDDTKVVTITDYSEDDRAPLKLTIETEAKYQGLKFNVTSLVPDNKILITEVNGTASTDLNEPEEITTVEYTISPGDNWEKDHWDCKEIPDIKMVVNYTSTGFIQSAEITDGKDEEGQFVAEIIGNPAGTRKIDVKIHIEDIDNDYRYDIKYVKVDVRDEKIKLEGVDFEIDITKESGTHKIHNVTTNASGIAKDRYLTAYGETTYVLTETKTKERYILDETPIEIVIGATDDNKVEILSKPEDVKVVVSDVSKEIIVTVKNKVDAEGVSDESTGYVGLVIEKTDSEDELVKIQDVGFSIIDDSTDPKTYVATTNEEGFAKILIPSIKENTEKTYTIIEDVPTGYIHHLEGNGEIKLKVTYDANGIAKAEIIKAPMDSQTNLMAKVTEIDQEGINIQISNEKTPYIETEQGELEPYNVKIVKIDENDIQLTKPGATLKVDVSNSIGANITKTDVTDENGVIEINEINGAGDIRIDITELEAPENMKLETETKWITLNRHSGTGNIVHTATNDVFYEIDNETRLITVYVTNRLDDKLHSIVINKVNSKNEGLAGAKFKVTLPDEITIEKEDGTEEQSVNIVSIEGGFAGLAEIPMPEDPGTYTYKIEEIEAPDEYKLPAVENKEITLNVTFDIVDNVMCITHVDIMDETGMCRLIDTENLWLEEEDETGNVNIKKNKKYNDTGDITTKNCFELDFFDGELEPMSIEIKPIDMDKPEKELIDAEFNVEIKNAGKTVKEVKGLKANADGKFIIDEIKKSGDLEIIIEQTVYTKGYQKPRDITEEKKIVKLNRDARTGNIAYTGDTPDDNVSIDGNAVTITIENELKDGELTIEINKKSKEDRSALKGAEFSIIPVEEGIEKTDKAIVLEATDNNGVTSKEITIPKTGTSYTYKLRETKAPKGYKKITQDKEIIITADVREDGTYGATKVTLDESDIAITSDATDVSKEKAVMEIANEAIEPIKIEIETVNKDNTDKKLSGAQYKIIVKDLDDNGKVIKEIAQTTASDTDGKILTEKIKGVGNLEITIEETVFPKGYKGTAEGVTITKTIKIARSLEDGKITPVEGIEADKIDNTKRVISLTVENELKDGAITIEVNKKDKDDSSNLKGAEFSIIPVENGTEQTAIVIGATDDNGVASKEITIPKTGTSYTYKLRETKAPKGYKKITQDKEIIITADVREDGTYGATKVTLDGENIAITPDTTDVSKEKAVMEIENEAIEPIQIEIETVNKDNKTQKLSGAQYKITVKDIDETDTTKQIIKVINPTTASDTLGKILTEEIKGVGNLEITIEETVFPKGYKGSAEGVTITKTIKIARSLEDGKITAVEGIEADKIDNTKRVISLTVENELKDGELTIEINKVTKEGSALTGAKFSLVGENGTEEIGTTDGQGKVSKTIVLGKDKKEFTYTLKETEAPKGYKKMEDKTITITTDVREDGTYGAIAVKLDSEFVLTQATNKEPVDKAVIEIENEEIEPIKIEIETVNKDNKTQKLSGAQYKITVKDLDETDTTKQIIKVINPTTASDALGKILTEEIKGVGNLEITIEETVFPKGYKGTAEGVTISKTIKIARDLSDGKITAKDGIESDKIDNTKRVISLTVENELKDGELILEINKVTKEGNALKGAKFSITPEKGEKLSLDATNGSVSQKIVIPKPAGKYTYTLSETETPKGYKTMDNKQIEITTDVRDDGTYGATEVKLGGTTIPITHEAKQDVVWETIDKAVMNIENEEIEPIQIQIETVNKDNTSQKLSGAEYKITVKDVDEEKEIFSTTTTSDELGKILTDEIKGVGTLEITIEETVFPRGYKGQAEGVNITKTIKIVRSLSDGTITKTTEGDQDYQIDNENRIISLTIENEIKKPILELTINKVDIEDDKPLEGAKFKIGTENLNPVELSPTDNNGQTKATLTLSAEEGQYSYSIEETEPPYGYLEKTEPMDLKINVALQENGSYAVESIIWDDEEIDVTEEKAAITVTNKKVAPFVIELTTKDDDPIDTELIPGASYDIIVSNSDTKETVSLRNVESNELGQILTKEMKRGKISILGNIEIKIKQVSVPDEYLLDEEEKVINIQRNIRTGEITVTGTNGKNIKVDEIDNKADEQKTIKITMINETMKPYFELAMEKVSIRSLANKLKGAKFEIKLPDGVTTDSGSDKIEVIFETAEKIVKQIPLPKKKGEYNYIITETQAPSGYNKLGTPIIVTVTVEKENRVFVAKNITTSGMVYLDTTNNLLQIPNQPLTASKDMYNINLNIQNMGYSSNSELKLNIESEAGEFTSRTIKELGKNQIGYLTGTGEITVSIYDVNQNGDELVGTVSYYRAGDDCKISYVQANITGKYEIEATVAENMKDVNITIRKPTTEVHSDIYSISEEEKIIYNVSPNTTVQEFANNISTNQGNYSVMDTNGNTTQIANEGGLKSAMPTNNLVGTGSKLKVGDTTYTIVVKGDVDGNGKITITDVTKINLHVVNINPIEGLFRIAADANLSKDVSITDLVQTNLALVNLFEL